MRTYTAQVQRDGKFWAIHVPEVDRWTQARTLREVDEMARDLIAIMDGPGSFDLTIDITLPEAARAHLDRSEELRNKAAQAKAQAAVESSLAARELVSAGMSMRDVGAALGVSYQRAHQLVSR